MQFRPGPACLLILVALFGACGDGPERENLQPLAPLTSEQVVSGFKQMCVNDRPAIEARQSERSLYERVGGREGLRRLVQDMVERHGANPELSRLMKDVDPRTLAASVTEFMVLATGGSGEYHGSYPEMTDPEFLAALSDLREAMGAAALGEFERQEMICAFLGLRNEAGAP